MTAKGQPAEPPLRVRQGPVMAAYLAVFFLAWIVVMAVFTAILIDDRSPVVFLPSLLLLLGFVGAFRSLRVAAWHDPVGDQLVLRNYVATVRVPRRQVRGFTQGDARRADSLLGIAVTVQLRGGGTHQVDVLARPLLTRRARERHATAVSRLHRWQASGR